MLLKLLLSIFILAKSSALQPSNGCGKTLPDSPKPGEYHRFFFQHNDIQLGPVQRDFIVQIPIGAYFNKCANHVGPMAAHIYNRQEVNNKRGDMITSTWIISTFGFILMTRGNIHIPI